MLEVRRSVCTATAVLLTGAALASTTPAWAPADGNSPEAVTSCMQANLPDETSIQQVLFRSNDRVGESREILAKIWWRRFSDGRSRVLLKVLGPDDIRDSSLLVIQRESGTDLFLYVPELQKVRRVTSQTLAGQLYGSDFTYEDFQQLQGITLEGRAEVEDATVDGIAAHALVQYPAEESGSMYQRIVSYVSKADCVPIKSEMWESEDVLRKVMRVDRETLFVQDQMRIPRMFRMDDEANKTSTTLEVQTIEVGTKIPRKMFEITTLERGQVK